MRLSFVVPTRNQARFIRRTLDGCRAQGIEDSEIVVVDGASTDGTPELLAAYGHGIRWLSEPDRGQADAVNKGVALARGDVVAWINSDDFYATDHAVRTALAAMDDGADVVHGMGVAVDAQGLVLRPYLNRPVTTARALLLSPSSVCQPATFFRRELFLRVGGLRTDLHLALDYDLFLRMFAAARGVRFVPETLACMTFHADAKSVARMGDQIRETVALKRRFADELGLGAADRARLWAATAPLYVYRAAVRLGLWRVA